VFEFSPTTSNGISLLFPDDKIGQIAFGTPSDNIGGRIRYFGPTHATVSRRDAMVFVTRGDGEMIITGNGEVGIGTLTPDAQLESFDATGTVQLRLSFEDSVKFADFSVDTNHDLTIKPSSTGQVIFQPTTDSIDFFQVLDADGGVPILNVDSINERVGIGDAAPDSQVVISTTGFIGPAAASGNTSSSDITIGLAINQEANDDFALVLLSSDVAHGMTDLAETDVWGGFQKAQATSGGCSVIGLKDADGVGGAASNFFGYLGENADTTKSTGAQGIIALAGYIKSGAGGGAVNADGNVVVMKNATTSLWLLDAEGTVHQIPGSDADFDIITVQVTGDPTISWDESEDAFSINKGLRVTSGDVGIGVVSPSYDLDIQNNTTNGDIVLARIANTETTATSTSHQSSLEFGFRDNAGASAGTIRRAGAVRIGKDGTFDTVAAGDSNMELVVVENLVDVIGMHITSGGLIGINGITSPSTELDVGAGAIEFEEMTAPGAGAANTARLFAQDNGAGKTQLAVRFNTGAIQIIATEP
jgi:hypothetical protein